MQVNGNSRSGLSHGPSREGREEGPAFSGLEWLEWGDEDRTHSRVRTQLSLLILTTCAYCTETDDVTHAFLKR